MADIITIKATDGSTVQYTDEICGSGAMKDVYFSPDRSYVVAFFRGPQDYNTIDRLQNIAGPYRERIFDQPGGDYWKRSFCWPTKLVEAGGRIGVVAPTYEDNFFFKYGSKNDDFLNIKGTGKEGKWFASANHQSKHLDDRERGDWRSYLSISIKISRAVRRMHAAGLAHSDLSYKNVLVDPSNGDACIIDIDGLVVPGKYPPDVLGTPDFIAPEVMATMNLAHNDSKRALPNRETDQHALSVLIYMYLLYRHPLRGRKIYNTDPQVDEALNMGAKALFIEHPTNHENRPNLDEISAGYLPWADVIKRPYSLAGPYLKQHFDQAFVQGLHDPTQRPSADNWERALVKTVDLIQPCSNANCVQKWYVFDNTTSPCCPFCGTKYTGHLPVLNFYSSRGKGKFTNDDHRLMVYSDQYLYPWHVNRRVFPNERLTEDQKKPVGYFKLHNGRWVFVNQSLPDMKVLGEDSTQVKQNSMLELKDGQQLLLSTADGGRLAHVQMAGGT